MFSDLIATLPTEITLCSAAVIMFSRLFETWCTGKTISETVPQLANNWPTPEFSFLLLYNHLRISQHVPHW